MSAQDQAINTRMIMLSNNSRLTNEASVILSKLSEEDKVKVRHWLQHAIDQQRILVNNASKKTRSFRGF